MCGRIAITLPPESVRAWFAYAEHPNFPPRTNVAPTQPVPIVRAERDLQGRADRHFRLVRWGFLPAFVKDPKDYPLVINARSETVAEKASFRNALRRRRCIFIADAFYEWRRPPGPRKKGGSTPFLFRRHDGAPLALAGLWEGWIGPNGEELETACILTTHANGLMSAVHDRMPVVLEKEDYDLWLDVSDERSDAAQALMRPAAEDVLEFFEIGPAVNSVANDSPSIQEPVGPVERASAPAAEAVPARRSALQDDPQGSLF